MNDLPYQEHPDWKDILARLSQIREEEDYSTANVDFIREHLQSFDDRVRGGAALAASGCLFEPYILDQVIQMAEEDVNPAIRKAAIQALGAVIHEGVMEGLEDASGSTTAMDEAEEWEEIQSGSLQEDYQRVKNLLLGFLELDEDVEIQESALSSLADLGFLPEVQEKIREYLHSSRQSAQLVALHAIGRYPQYWEDELFEMIKADTPTALLKEAISACYSSESARLASAIEGVLDHSDPEVLRYALLTLANINKSDNLMEILQKFSLHENPLVQEA
ncbi:MAG: hypothetical protein D6732_22430, partial [Methanobacteriota archaeon]